MRFETQGDPRNPAVLFFHAMGVTGASSEPVAKYLQEKYFCILPTSTVYCRGQRYRGKAEEVRQVEEFLRGQGISRLAMVVASSLGADVAVAFLSQGDVPVGCVYFDGGQFAQIGKGLRRLMTPFLYAALRSLYRSGGKNLRRVMWCDDDAIRPYFVAAGGAVTYGNLRRQMADSLENRPFPPLPEDLLKHTYFAFGSAEEHYKYRDAVMRAYPAGHFPVFEGYNHMQYQIRDPQGFAQMLECLMEQGRMPELPFLRK